MGTGKRCSDYTPKGRCDERARKRWCADYAPEAATAGLRWAQAGSSTRKKPKATNPPLIVLYL
jgi:hypothetical protein